ncbi:hypothetical protein AWB77_01232 [Caballeronia fortuita]|uniref:Lipoprotein n=1 Tax=Caballeronia fortuita TaxID=1777138 RepID=A0A157ZXN7_9BURK|nr:hypothetical protein [Caballeronia fortuita]SAK50304.1 hypothetical protein AWB77_01232 [Caballeronia fortuita]
MKARINRKLLAIMAAIAVAANLVAIGVAQAQGMPADAQQLVQTMRPIYMSLDSTADMPAQTAAAPQQASGDDSAYGGMKPASASGHRDGYNDGDSGCSAASCKTFFGQ